MAQGQFRGIFSIPVTPFHPDGSLDVESLRRCIDFTVEAGAHGVVTPVNASEFYTLSDEERRLVVRTAVEVVDHRVPVVASCTGVSIPHAVELARYAQEVGADALIARPPVSRPAPLPEIYEYYRAIGEAVEIPIFVQNWAGVGGTPMPPDFLVRLVREIPHVEYIKEESQPPGPAVTAVLEKAGEACRGVMGGMGGRYLLDEYRRGACGNMPACHITDVHVRLWSLLEGGREQEARALYYKMLPLLNFEAMYGIACYKEVLYRRGVIASPTLRVPYWQKLDRYDLMELDAILDSVSELFTWRAPRARR